MNYRVQGLMFRVFECVFGSGGRACTGCVARQVEPNEVEERFRKMCERGGEIAETFFRLVNKFQAWFFRCSIVDKTLPTRWSGRMRTAGGPR
jgi:hypothetical protein